MTVPSEPRDQSAPRDPSEPHHPTAPHDRGEPASRDTQTGQAEPSREGSQAWNPWSGDRDATGPVELGDTREVPRADAAPVSSSTPASSTAPAPSTTHPGAPAPAPAWAAYDRPAATSSSGAASSPSYAAPGHQPPPAAPQAQPAAPQRRRGPGWGSLVAVALACSLLGGLGGGLLGAWLMGSPDTDRPVNGATSGSTPQPGPGATTRPEGSIANIAANATPSVVTIRVEAGSSGGSGSGWVYDDRGHIVTNNHVVADAAEGGKITVVLSTGERLPAKIVGRDVSYDLAVLNISRTDLRPIPVGDSAKVVVGDGVIAVGAPLGLDSTVTTGIVSALNRPVAPGEADDQSYINAIQTDAAINPGNSGGPLLDMNGQVIGVNSAIARAPGTGITGQSGNIGVGFAIPSEQVKRTADQLIKTGKAQHPVIGVYLDREFTGEGVRIAASGPNGQPAVAPGGPAEKAGLKAGDIVTEFEGRRMDSPDELVVAIRSKGVGSDVKMTIKRGGETISVTMTLQGSGD